MATFWDLLLQPLVSCVSAVKILEKRHIIREKKVQYVSREKEVMLMLEHPFFIQLYFTFQDKDSLCIPSAQPPQGVVCVCVCVCVYSSKATTPT